ncbi:MAG TPA: 4-hydroxy-tetrahydrodipicolinate reductase, partial [Vicinamibacteria bacterium]|nr:4-hydroxy-tetrahydrodipicolinate reductase [Vicinamibacteria bacterium]
MKLAVVGHGKMGREVEAVARERGHEVVVVRHGEAFPAGAGAGIDFTRAEAVIDNTGAALAAGARYVIGTTGWDGRMDELRALVDRSGGGVVHAANFSLGVNLFYKVVREAAALFAHFP